jgi:hypothetical protein
LAQLSAGHCRSVGIAMCVPAERLRGTSCFQEMQERHHSVGSDVSQYAASRLLIRQPFGPSLYRRDAVSDRRMVHHNRMRGHLSDDRH